MTTKAELEATIADLEKRLSNSVNCQYTLVREKKEVEGRNNILQNAARNQQGQIDHTRHAIEAFVATECPYLDLDELVVPVLPDSIMKAMGVRPAAPAPTPAAPRPMGQSRDVVADILKHLHGLVS